MKKRSRKKKAARFDQMLDRLKFLGFWARHAADQAEAKMAQLNSLLHQLFTLGWIGETVILGPIIDQQPYAPQPGGAESGQVVQAALCIPGGLGVLLWDTEEHAQLGQIPEGLESEARLRLQPFDRCQPVIRALLYPHIEPLVGRLLGRLSAGAESRRQSQHGDDQ